MFARSRPNEIESSFSTERLGNRSLAKKEEERKGWGEGRDNECGEAYSSREGNLRNGRRVR